MFVFKKQVEEVVLHATVYDEERRMVPGLDKNAFAVYDDALLQFTWFRVPYDLLGAQRRIRRAALPDLLAARLRSGI